MTDNRYLLDYFIEKSQPEKKPDKPQTVAKPKKSKEGKKS